MTAKKAATIFKLAIFTYMYQCHNFVSFARQLVSISEMSLQTLFESKQNVQNIKVAATKKAVTILI